MSQNEWGAVDDYIVDALVKPDEALNAALRDSALAGLPAINVTANQGKLLHLLARMQRARRILEVGTLGGYSTIWLARALPADGQLITLELDPKHATVAQANIHRAGLASVVDIRVGPALDSLAKLYGEKPAPFDFIFLDADKPNNPAYLDWALKLSRPGTVIIADNVVREGEIINDRSADARVIGTRTLLERLGSHPQLDATAIQTVSTKGYDGFAMAVVKASA